MYYVCVVQMFQERLRRITQQQQQHQMGGPGPHPAARMPQRMPGQNAGSENPLDPYDHLIRQGGPPHPRLQHPSMQQQHPGLPLHHPGMRQRMPGMVPPYNGERGLHPGAHPIQRVAGQPYPVSMGPGTPPVSVGPRLSAPLPGQSVTSTSSMAGPTHTALSKPGDDAEDKDLDDLLGMYE